MAYRESKLTGAPFAAAAVLRFEGATHYYYFSVRESNALFPASLGRVKALSR
jgi:hypothetical protein